MLLGFACGEGRHRTVRYFVYIDTTSVNRHKKGPEFQG